MSGTDLSERPVDLAKPATAAELLPESAHAGQDPVVAVRWNNRIVDLGSTLAGAGRLAPVFKGSEEGMVLVRRSLCFLWGKAVEDLFPERPLEINHSIGPGFYGVLGNSQADLTDKTVAAIRDRMQDLIEADLPFVGREVGRDEAIARFEAAGKVDKVEALRHAMTDTVMLYQLGDSVESFIGPLVPRTSLLTPFDLLYHPPGMILRFPLPDAPNTLPEYHQSPKLFRLFNEFERWARVLGVRDVARINDLIEREGIGEFILISEAFHEMKIFNLARQIKEQAEDLRLILISGPSASGKTTFSKRLRLALRVMGLRPVTIGVDHYFRAREETPRDEAGEYDFEHLEAIDTDLFSEHLLSLIKGGAVVLPAFDFKSGKRRRGKRRVRVTRDQIIIVEGIHALNDGLTPTVPNHLKFKIYVSALTHLKLDRLNRISTTDTRKIRRIVRDSQFRGTTARETLRRWPSISRGERRWIFPFQEGADGIFNSALLFELSALRPKAEAVLREIPEEAAEHAEAVRLLAVLSFFRELEPSYIPASSILREFLGGSVFSYGATGRIGL